MSVRILAVDDEASTRLMVSSILRQAGFEVVSVSGGEEALQLLASQVFHLVVLDMHMEDLDGLGVLREVRKNRSLFELPVLIVSADSDTPLMVEALESGASDYLIKPVAPALLLTKIKRHLATAEPKSRQVAALGAGSHYAGYEILEALGETLGGRLYRARHLGSMRQVALRLTDHEVMTPALNHPNIVTLHEVGDRFVAVELLHGDPLDRIPLPLEVNRAIAWTVDILSGLAAIHAAGLIYGHLRPESILVTESGSIKLTEPWLTETATFAGSRSYLAPEQVDPLFGPVSPASDLFSAGGVLYTMLTGCEPFPPATPGQQCFTIAYANPRPPSQLNPEVSSQLQEICLKALQKNPFRRFGTAEEFAQALRVAVPTP